MVIFLDRVEQKTCVECRNYGGGVGIVKGRGEEETERGKGRGKREEEEGRGKREEGRGKREEEEAMGSGQRAASLR
jgi:hypothetical protein